MTNVWGTPTLSAVEKGSKARVLSPKLATSPMLIRYKEPKIRFFEAQVKMSCGKSTVI